MADLQTQPPDATTGHAGQPGNSTAAAAGHDQPTGTGASGGTAGADPLARLHKMSTTAGISSQEYVAINIPSLVATFLGLASTLALLEPIFLIVAATGAVCGVIALRQIRDSNGTQAGRAFAYLGIVLSVLLGGAVLAMQVYQSVTTRSDQQAIAGTITRLGEHIAADNYDAAYAMFSGRFRERVKPDKFKSQWGMIETAIGQIRSMEWNRVAMRFEEEPGSGTRVATAMALFHFEGARGEGRQPVILRKTEGTWVIDDMPQVFPPENAGRGPRRGR